MAYDDLPDEAGPLTQAASAPDTEDDSPGPLTAAAPSVGLMDGYNPERAKLFDLLQHPNIDRSSKWLAFAAGMGAPTKTGDFGESMSSGLAGLAKGQQAENVLENQYREMLTKQYAQMAQQRMMLNGLSTMAGGQPGVVPSQSAGVPPDLAAPTHSLINPATAQVLMLTDPTGKAVSSYISKAAELPESLKPVALKYGIGSPQFNQAVDSLQLKATYIQGPSVGGRNGVPTYIGPKTDTNPSGLYLDPTLTQAAADFIDKRVTAEETARAPWKNVEYTDPTTGEKKMVSGATMYKMLNPGADLPAAPPKGWEAAPSMGAAIPATAAQPGANFQGDPKAILAQIMQIQDPTEKVKALQAYSEQLSGSGNGTQVALPGGPAALTTAPSVATATKLKADADRVNTDYTQRVAEYNAGQTTLATLQELKTRAAASPTMFGPGHDLKTDIASMVGLTNADMLHAKELDKAAADSFIADKLAARLPMLQMQQAGSTASDARQRLAEELNPHTTMNATALIEASNQLSALTKMQMAQKLALDKAGGTANPTAYNNAQTDFTGNADYRIWQYLDTPNTPAVDAKGKPVMGAGHTPLTQRQAYLKSMPADQAAEIVKKASFLRSKGWL